MSHFTEDERALLTFVGHYRGTRTAQRRKSEVSTEQESIFGPEISTYSRAEGRTPPL